MKIAILTLPFNNNYGGLLQSYALQIILKRRGHDVTVLKVTSILPATSFKESVYRFLKIVLGKERENQKRLKKISKNMKAFEEINMNTTAPIYSQEDFGSYDNFDAYVVGSDQVWRFDYTKERRKNYFLDFVTNQNALKISFAASFGIDEWKLSKSQTQELSELASKFDSISVREKSGVKLCREHLNVTASHILDPAILVEPELYTGLICENKSDHIPSNGLLIYMLDYGGDKQKTAEIISKELKCTPFRVGVQKANEGTFDDKMVYPSVGSWIEGFKKAKFIITDSFHGCLFSILFNKPFIVYGNTSRGITRFDSILETFNLKKRFVIHSSEISRKVLEEGIDYDRINQIIASERELAQNFLDNAGL
ncbi:polysaccharide pyruvyl transferase family protein [Cytophaga sp. FL35]|uniref:polysaccharide pyruvyl transferase family protein n=1 Tax=Cytophaga sp. FL35 TaxID=1904456 RepID=UPI0016534B1C|nr:polysaccharide pyruvyl transferase family protein [Cytophaga sp. FL35]MBC6999402.1 polysaccharide pyruvyl transferase family protein [Cytophaga sp. FL35]